MHTVLSSMQHLVFSIFIKSYHSNSHWELIKRIWNEWRLKKHTSWPVRGHLAVAGSLITAFSFSSCSLMKLVLDVVDGRWVCTSCDWMYLDSKHLANTSGGSLVTNFNVHTHTHTQWNETFACVTPSLCLGDLITHWPKTARAVTMSINTNPRDGSCVGSLAGFVVPVTFLHRCVLTRPNSPPHVPLIAVLSSLTSASLPLTLHTNRCLCPLCPSTTFSLRWHVRNHVRSLSWVSWKHQNWKLHSELNVSRCLYERRTDGPLFSHALLCVKWPISQLVWLPIRTILISGLLLKT